MFLCDKQYVIKRAGLEKSLDLKFRLTTFFYLRKLTNIRVNQAERFSNMAKIWIFVQKSEKTQSKRVKRGHIQQVIIGGK